MKNATGLLDPTGGNIDPFFYLMDPKFANNITEVLSANFVSAYDYPWNSVDQVTALIDQTTIDVSHAASFNGSFGQTQKVFNTYDARVSPGDQRSNPSNCSDSSGECFKILWVGRNTLFANTRTSGRGSDWTKVILDESAIAGGVAFCVWFLTIYMT